jgi:hypothetical protein
MFLDDFALRICGRPCEFNFDAFEFEFVCVTALALCLISRKSVGCFYLFNDHLICLLVCEGGHDCHDHGKDGNEDADALLLGIFCVRRKASRHSCPEKSHLHHTGESNPEAYVQRWTKVADRATCVVRIIGT